MIEEENIPSNTVTLKRSHLYAALLPLAFVIGLSVGYVFWGRSSAAATTQPAAAAADQARPATSDAITAEEPVNDSAANQPATIPTADPAEAEAQQEIVRYDIPEDDDYAWGPADAPITIIEFSDYECPFCQKWHTQIWPQVQAAYPDQIRLVFRDFPLTSIHPNATPAAAAANCAGEQDAYYEFNDVLFLGVYGLSSSAYERYANDLGLDMAAFTECVESNRYTDEVQADFDFAANLGVRSTPTFFINGIAIVGAQPFEVFQNVIDQELAGEIP